jgi:ABC-type multidrug transport system fused ATPase/permease subunit
VTDIVSFEGKTLQYHPGNFSQYETAMAEIWQRKLRILDNQKRQTAAAKEVRTSPQLLFSLLFSFFLCEFYESCCLLSLSNTSRFYLFLQFQNAHKQVEGKLKHSKRGHAIDPKKQKQAASKARKVEERAGYYRADGKRYKTRSLKKLSEDALRLPEKIREEELRLERIMKFKFPEVDASELRLTSKDSPLIAMEAVSCGYTNSLSECVLQKITGQVSLNSRIALVGSNGSGKSTLLKLLTGTLSALTGTCTHARNIRWALRIKVSVVTILLNSI